MKTSLPLTFQTSDMLWATRGYKWGFRRLLEPRGPNLEGSSLYDSTFGKNFEENQTFIRGGMNIGGRKLSYYGARFLDPDASLIDLGKRRISHEILIIVDGKSADMSTILPGDWHLQILSQLHSEYKRLYSMLDGDLSLRSDVLTHITIERSSVPPIEDWNPNVSSLLSPPLPQVNFRLLILWIGLLSCGAFYLNHTRHVVSTIGVADAAKLLETGRAIVVDSRPRDAFAVGHVKGAINISPSEESLGSKLLDLAGRDVLVISSDVNGKPTELIRVLSLKHPNRIRIIEGGFGAWTASGHPVEASSN